MKQFAGNACAQATGRIPDFNITRSIEPQVEKMRMYQTRRVLLVVEGQILVKLQEQNDNRAGLWKLGYQLQTPMKLPNLLFILSPPSIYIRPAKRRAQHSTSCEIPASPTSLQTLVPKPDLVLVAHSK